MSILMKEQPKPFIIPVSSDPTINKVDAVINNPNIRKGRVQFDIYTYKNLKTVKPDHNKWFLMDAVNDFTATLDNDEWDTLSRMFIGIKTDCLGIQSTESVFPNLAKISLKIDRTFKKLDLINRAITFAQGNERIIYVAIKNQGKRLQDRPELTWGEEEYRALTGLSIIMKLLFPVFGEIIHRFHTLRDNTNEGKEVYAVSVIENTIKETVPEIYNKLLFYIANDVRKGIDKDDIAAMYGITHSAINKRCVAIILIKNMVNFDLHDEKSLMTYINVTVQKAAKTNYNKKSNVHYSDWSSLQSANTDERNDSNLDDTIGVFTDKIEKRYIINHAADRAILKYSRINNFREDLLASAYDYYNRQDNIPPLTVFNELIMGVFIAPEVGSAYSLRYMNYDKISRLISVIQLYMIRTGYSRLVPLMSVIPTDVDCDINAITNNIMLDRGQGSAYNYLKAKLEHLSKFMKVGAYLDKFAHFIVAQEFKLNVATDILDLSEDVKFSPEGYWRYDKNILAQMFGFVYKLIVEDSRLIQKEEHDGNILQARALKVVAS